MKRDVALPKKVLPFFCDNNVPQSVGESLTGAGHDVELLRDVMLHDTADPVVATKCVTEGKILITHDTDFKSVRTKISLSRKVYNQLNRIQLRCDYPNDAKRISEALSLIENEWALILNGERDRMVIEVGELFIKVHR